jgi:hypothetical protein
MKYSKETWSSKEDKPERKRPLPFIVILIALGVTMAAIAMLSGHIGWNIHAGLYGVSVLAIIVWYPIAKRMTINDTKAAIVVDIDNGTIWPIIVGREMWKAMEKVGKPLQAFETPSGTGIELLKRFDPDSMELEYPYPDELTDIHIAMISGKYKAIIEELRKLRIEVHELRDNKDLQVAREGLKRGRMYAMQLNDIFSDIMDPEGPEKGGSS